MYDGEDQLQTKGVGMALILVVEDDREIADMLELYLRHDGHQTERASDGEGAMQLFRAARPDLVILDVGLPKLDGLEVLRRIREAGRTPVVMLTARSEEVDELLGLGLGADSYLTKPCSPRKVMAHVKAVLRRNNISEEVPEVVRVGPLEVDSYRVEARVGKTVLHLTPTEFKLLETLAHAPGKAMSRTELFDAAMPESDALERAIDRHLKNIRAKLAEQGADDILETVRGVGYRLMAR